MEGGREGERDEERKTIRIIIVHHASVYCICMLYNIHT